MEQLYPEMVARFYDVVYAQVRDGVDKDYYLRQIAQCTGPVLELGAGTGRLFCEARAGGADIYGIDISPAMVAKLQGKLNDEERRRVWVADALQLRLERRFELILAPFRMLSHLQRVAEQLRLLDVVYEHLAPGGRFIFDVYVPALRLLLDGMDGLVDFDGEYAPGLRLRRVLRARSDLVSQTTEVTMSFFWDEDGKEQRGDYRFAMRFFFRYEIEHLIARSRLTLRSIHGDFAGGPLGPDSREFVVVCGRD